MRLIGAPSSFALELGPVDEVDSGLRTVRVHVAGQVVTGLDTLVYVPHLADVLRADAARLRAFPDVDPLFAGRSPVEAFDLLMAGDPAITSAEHCRLSGACRFLDWGVSTDHLLGFLIPGPRLLCARRDGAGPLLDTPVTRADLIDALDTAAADLSTGYTVFRDRTRA
ncbi:hypothetical protein [Actinokineospora iranica]|uniref:Uncharacterized protein n=1 Tax=Actinokineospora iranica TaxID=1271860 RepID=A0A1G6SQS7_9PSEU|nr:hypothetical protein [Actinokineospora iranica]SDD19199.1 hypothetical protein SAMN05216174_108120 [Actinokineospora iranica]